jgi:hypothetical protein
MGCLYAFVFTEAFMEWACGVGRDLHGPHILVEDSKRRLSKLALKGAVSAGIPTGGDKKLGVTLDLKAYQTADPEDYVRAFGFAPGTHRSSHTVFKFLNNEDSNYTTHVNHVYRVAVLIIPSLVFIRALFRPSRYMLPALFQPQALDHVRYMETTDGVPRLQMLASWADSSLDKYGDVLGPLTWMSCFPSAVAMAHSVFAFASEGILAIQLPLASARMSANGVKIGETLYVTRLTIIEVVARERPVRDAEHSPVKIVYHAVSKTYSLQKNPLGRLPPKKADGSIELTDTEWLAIRPILTGSTPTRRFKLDQRKIFDGVLRKLSEGIGWRVAGYAEGGKENAAHAWRTWVRNGRWDLAIAQLEILRR